MKDNVKITTEQEPPKDSVLVLDDEDFSELFNNPDSGIEAMSRIGFQYFSKIFVPVTLKGSDIIEEFKQLLEVWSITVEKIYYYED